MKRLYNAFAGWLAVMGQRDSGPDAMAGLSPRQLADLPAWHPAQADRPAERIHSRFI